MTQHLLGYFGHGMHWLDDIMHIPLAVLLRQWLYSVRFTHWLMPACAFLHDNIMGETFYCLQNIHACGSGASSDLEQATKLARNMVTKYGMSEKVGNICIDYEDDGRSLSSETRSAVEEEVSC